jgi:hypothetical protein
LLTFISHTIISIFIPALGAHYVQIPSLIAGLKKPVDTVPENFPVSHRKLALPILD